MRLGSHREPPRPGEISCNANRAASITRDGSRGWGSASPPSTWPEGSTWPATVRNLPDGRVELVAEGEPAEIDGFLQAVRDAMGRYIRDESIESIPPSPTPLDRLSRYVTSSRQADPALAWAPTLHSFRSFRIILRIRRPTP